MKIAKLMAAFSELFTNAVVEAGKAFSALYDALYGPENEGMTEASASFRPPQKRAQRPSRRLPRGQLVASRHLPYQMRRF